MNAGQTTDFGIKIGLILPSKVSLFVTRVVLPRTELIKKQTKTITHSTRTQHLRRNSQNHSHRWEGNYFTFWTFFFWGGGTLEMWNGGTEQDKRDMIQPGHNRNGKVNMTHKTWPTFYLMTAKEIKTKIKTSNQTVKERGKVEMNDWWA